MEYIRFLRTKVGQEKVMLNFAGGIVFDKEGLILLQKRREQQACGISRRRTGTGRVAR